MRREPIPLPASTAILSMIALSLFLWVLILSAGKAFSQTSPSGQAVLDSGLAARALTKSDTTDVPVTRGIYIGDAAACDVALILNADTSAVTFSKVQPGTYYPFAIRKLMSTNTTCAAVVAIY